MGSWRFIVLQTIVVVLWVAGNIYALGQFDHYPFIFLNLAFSTWAAYAAPLILLASNQSAGRDRATLEYAARGAPRLADQPRTPSTMPSRIIPMTAAATPA